MNLIQRQATSSYNPITILVLLLLLSPCAFSLPQSSVSKQEASDRRQPTFKIPVDVIVVSAAVTDKDGNPATDLTRDDFKVFEDGKLQAIQTFSLESYAPIPSAAMPKSASDSRLAANPNTNPIRMISIIIDDISPAPPDHFLSVANAITRFVESDMGTEDQIAILSGSGRIKHPFSNNKHVLLEEIGAVLNASGSTASQMVDGAERTQKDESNYWSSSLLDYLRHHIRSLKHFDATKEIVFFSAGFLADDDMVRHKLQEVVDQALEVGIVINTVDTRGLFNPYFVAPEKQFVSAKQLRSIADEAYAKATPLSVLADETGGIFYHNDNDLYAGLKKLSIPKAIYYLTYAIALHKPDDRYHHIKLEVSRPGLKLTYRKGYFTPKEELTFQRRKREDILEAMQTPGNLNEIPIDLGYNCAQEDDSYYNVSFLANVDIRRLHFLDEDSRHKNLINLVVVVFDENDHYIDGLEKSIDFRLSEASYANLLSEGLMASVTFKLTFGRYKIKTVVREGIQGRMGSLTRMIEVP
jgi:VWFA-related protein